MSSVGLTIRVSETAIPSLFSGPTLIALGCVGFVGLVAYVWYLWSLGRLFPALGLPSSSGWIPVWNDWQLIQRAGLPGWTSLLGLIPGLSIIKFVYVVISIHRINIEHDQTSGMTVLGFLIRPLWATILGSRLLSGAPNQRGTGANRWLVTYGPDGQVYPLLSQEQAAPAADREGSAVDRLFGPTEEAPSVPALPRPPAPQWHAPDQGVQPGLPAGSFAFNAPVPSGTTPPGVMPPVPPARPQAPAGSVPSPETPPTEDNAVPSAEQPPNPWGFGRTTEDHYQRLASEPPLARSALESQADGRPFSWPEAQVPVVPVVPPQPPAPQHEAPQPLVPQPFVPQPFAPQAPAPQPIVSAPSDAHLLEDDDLDQTVVVRRGPAWVLVLPDGRELALEGDDVVIGRRPVALDGSSTLLVPDPTRTLSKSHARLRQSGDAWTVEDLNSTNGVYLLGADGETAVRPGVQVLIGDRFIIGTLEVLLRRID